MTRPWRKTAAIAAALGIACLAGAVSSAEVEDCPDTWVTNKIIRKLVAEGIVYVEVHTEVCAVTLTGCVKTDEKRQKAQKAAESTDHVESVDNQLVICPRVDEDPPSD